GCPYLRTSRSSGNAGGLSWPCELAIGLGHQSTRKSARLDRRQQKRLAVHAPTLEWARKVGIHELKHVIDRIEKHPPGGSPDQFMKLGIPEQEACDLYNRLVGEVAARNAQKRLDWGDIIRRYRRPATTEDVPRHQQINLYDH